MLPSPFLCQPSSDQRGQVYTPNIPDSYFNHEAVAQFRPVNLTSVLNRRTYIFAVPPVSAERNCSGDVVGFQYCYQTTDANVQNEASKNLFNFLSLTQNEFEFTVNESFVVKFTSSNTTCVPPPSGTTVQQVCCDTTTLGSEEVFHLPRSNFTFGIVTRAARLLAFEDATLVGQVKLFEEELATRSSLLPAGDNFTLTETEPREDGFLPIIRLLIGKTVNYYILDALTRLLK